MKEIKNGYRWAERVEVNKLEEYLYKESTALDYLRKNVATGWSILPNLKSFFEKCRRCSK